ncbi:MAG: type III secretion chaperone [Chlamydiia bacterium]|nr:type III secretion chaperone [Chlamydiia bacterium]
MADELEIDWQELLGWGRDELNELRNCGYSYIRQGKYDIGVKFFRALVALDTDNAYDAQTLGAILLEMNENEEALEVLVDALKLEPNHGPTLLNQAKALFALGHREEGLRIVRFLKKSKDRDVASMAKALLLAYS